MAIHGAEDFDAGAAGGVSGDIGAGGDEGLVETGDELVGHEGAGLANGEASGVAGGAERDGGRGGQDDGQRAGPEAAGKHAEARGDFAGEFFDHQGIAHEDRERAIDGAAFRLINLADGVEAERVSNEGVQSVGGNGDDLAVPYRGSGAIECI